MATKFEERRTLKFLARNPFFVGEVDGIKFYDHPNEGSPLVSITKDGILKHTIFFDLPRRCDIE